MKKTLAIIFAAALALSLTTGVFAAEPVDITADATVTDDGLANHKDGYVYGPECAVDADLKTGWQKSGDTNNAGEGNTWISQEKNDGVDVYLEFAWEVSKSISSFKLVNEASNIVEEYSKGGYKVQYLSGDEWKEVAGLTESRVDDEAAKSTELTANFDACTTTKLRIVMVQGIAASKYAPKVYDVRIFGTDAPVVEDTTDDDKTESGAPAADDKEDDKTEASKPDTSKPADTGKPSTNPDTGVESVAVWAVLFAAAAAVVLTVKKARA